MADQSSFDRNHIETSAMSETSGVLDQLNLPPAVIGFLRKNQRILWILIALVTSVVVVVALYGSYRNYKINQAVSALDAATQEQGDQRIPMLTEVAEKYSSTPSSLWSRIKLAKIAADKGDNATALVELQQVNKSISIKNPLKPLVLYRLAGLKELEEDYAAAIELYRQLTSFTGFVSDAHYAMGRGYVAMGKKDEAIEEYRQYLSLTQETGGLNQGDPVRTLVEHTINQLKE